MAKEVDDFQKFRAELNEEILNCGHLGIKRFFALDHQAYDPASATLVLLQSLPPAERMQSAAFAP